MEKRLCIKCCKGGHFSGNCEEKKSLPFPDYLKVLLPTSTIAANKPAAAAPSFSSILPKPRVNHVEAELNA